MNYNLWYMAPQETAGKLISAYTKYPDGNDPNAVLTAQPFTVSLKTVMIAKDHRQALFERLFSQDGILILSSNSLGSKPEVQRIHYYQDHLPLDVALNNFLADTVYVCDDYSGNERLWLEFHLVGVGMDPGEREALVSKFTSLAETAGGIFPAILPYSYLASSIVDGVSKLLNDIYQNRQLLYQRISLYPHHPSIPGQPNTSIDQNTPILREGTYVLLDAAIDNSQYVLQDDCSLSPCPDISYIVFNVEKANVPSPDWVTSQRVAMLLTQLKDGNPNAEQAPIEFLMDTLTGYSNFTHLQRYQDLLGKRQQAPGQLTPAEQTLLEQIATLPDLKPFLPK